MVFTRLIPDESFKDWSILSPWDITFLDNDVIIVTWKFDSLGNRIQPAQLIISSFCCEGEFLLYLSLSRKRNGSPFILRSQSTVLANETFLQGFPDRLVDCSSAASDISGCGISLPFDTLTQRIEFEQQIDSWIALADTNSGNKYQFDYFNVAFPGCKTDPCDDGPGWYAQIDLPSGVPIVQPYVKLPNPTDDSVSEVLSDFISTYTFLRLLFPELWFTAFVDMVPSPDGDGVRVEFGVDGLPVFVDISFVLCVQPNEIPIIPVDSEDEIRVLVLPQWKQERYYDGVLFETIELSSLDLVKSLVVNPSHPLSNAGQIIGGDQINNLFTLYPEFTFSGFQYGWYWDGTQAGFNPGSVQFASVGNGRQNGYYSDGRYAERFSEYQSYYFVVRGESILLAGSSPAPYPSPEPPPPPPIGDCTYFYEVTLNLTFVPAIIRLSSGGLDYDLPLEITLASLVVYSGSFTAPPGLTFAGNVVAAAAANVINFSIDTGFDALISFVFPVYGMALGSVLDLGTSIQITSVNCNL